jgi:dienelactone hydrolase
VDVRLGFSRQARERATARRDGALDQRSRTTRAQDRQQQADGDTRAEASFATRRHLSVPGTLLIVLRIVLLILLVVLPACKSPVRHVAAPSLAAAPEAPAVDIFTTRLARGWIEVTVSAPREPAGPKPVVISPIVPETELLERGFVVVRFHTNWESLRGLGGKRATADTDPVQPSQAQVGAWLLAAPRPGIVGRAYFDIISMDAENVVPQVIDYLITLPEVDASRIALTGSSTSGFVALQAMAVEPRIAVGVVRVACGDYMRFLKSSSLALNDDPRWLADGKVVLDPDYAVEIAAREPIRQADRYPPRPLLLLAGEKDRAIPFACVETTVQRFDATYRKRGAGERFRFIAFPESGHNLDDVANAAIVPWLEQWLAPDVIASAR